MSTMYVCMYVVKKFLEKTHSFFSVFSHGETACSFMPHRTYLKEKKTQSKCMFRLGDDDIESPYKKFLDTFDFFV